MGASVTALGNLNEMGVMDPRTSWVKLPHSVTKGEVGMVTLTDSRVKAAIWRVQTYDIG